MLAFTLGDHPERPVTDLAHPGTDQQAVRLRPVFGRVPVPPGLQRAVAAAHHDVARGQVGSQLPGHRTADQRDTRAQRPHVDRAEPSPEDLDRPRRGPQPRRGHLQQRRLARAVGPEDDPAVRRADAPVDPFQHRHALTADGDASERERRCGARWSAVTPRRGRRDAPGDAPDEAGTALRPRALAGQPEPDLAPVAEDDLPEVLLAQTGHRPGSASGSRARRTRPSSPVSTRSRSSPSRTEASQPSARTLGSSGRCSTGAAATVNGG